MQVQDVMKTDIFSIASDTPLRDAINLLYSEKVSGVMVVDVSGEMLGMLSEKDIYKTLYPSYEDFMATPERFTDFQNQEHNINDITAHNYFIDNYYHKLRGGSHIDKVIEIFNS